MSLKETPMTQWYWNTVGGILIEEYCVVPRGSYQGGRWVDGLIILGTEKKRFPPRSDYDIAARDVVVVQSKYRRLNMPLMGQALFSRELVLRIYPPPRSVKSVAICIQNDAMLRSLFEAQENCEVAVYPHSLSRDLPLKADAPVGIAPSSRP